MAKLYMEKGRDQDAADTLNTLVTTRANSELKMVGRLRLAKVFLYQEKHQEMIELLAGFDDTSFAARYDELLGDAYAALGQIAEGRGGNSWVYEAWITSLRSLTSLRTLITHPLMCVWVM